MAGKESCEWKVALTINEKNKWCFRKWPSNNPDKYYYADNWYCKYYVINACTLKALMVY